jgi:hypothetical protein
MYQQLEGMDEDHMSLCEFISLKAARVCNSYRDETVGLRKELETVRVALARATEDGEKRRERGRGGEGQKEKNSGREAVERERGRRGKRGRPEREGERLERLE